MMLMLVDIADSRYGGAPDPDGEREKRWETADRRVTLPFAGAFTCLVAAGGGTSPEAVYGFTAAAVGLAFMGTRAALAERARDRRAAAQDDMG